MFSYRSLQTGLISPYYPEIEPVSSEIPRAGCRISATFASGFFSIPCPFGLVGLFSTFLPVPIPFLTFRPVPVFLPAPKSW
jgi:hypothetical protein